VKYLRGDLVVWLYAMLVQREQKLALAAYTLYGFVKELLYFSSYFTLYCKYL
jgi:hypothetical protein